MEGGGGGGGGGGALLTGTKQKVKGPHLSAIYHFDVMATNNDILMINISNIYVCTCMWGLCMHVVCMMSVTFFVWHM